MCHDFLIKRERDIVSDPLHPTPKTNENATLFLRLGLPSALIRHENGVFKNPFQTRNFQNHAPCWRFSLDKKHFENVGFQKNDDVLVSMSLTVTLKGALKLFCLE